MRRNESFKVWSHGYPYRTVRWHFHPEYEIHLVTATSGTFLVGDYVGTFETRQPRVHGTRTCRITGSATLLR